jgi:hypothetical protein
VSRLSTGLLLVECGRAPRTAAERPGGAGSLAGASGEMPEPIPHQTERLKDRDKGVKKDSSSHWSR